MGDHSIHHQPPIGESVGVVTFELVRGRRGLVGERRFRNHAARKLARQRMPGQQPLRGVCQRFSRAVDSAVIGRDQSVAARQAIGHSQSHQPCPGRQARCDQLPA